MQHTDIHENGILPIVPEEVDGLDKDIGEFQAGDMAGEAFRPRRLQHGTYGQRQPNVYMLRVKIPFGSLNPSQLKALAEIAEDYAPQGIGHVTTRQDMQFHFLELERVPKALRLLAEVGLTSREACGNVVRNVTGCPLAGVCPSEPFDVSPYAAAFSRYFLRHPVSQNLPRKFKVAFSGCQEDCALTPIHDLGFVAKIRRTDGGEEQGFSVSVGGGLSALPRIAQPLYDFVPLESYLKVSEAVLRVFDRQGERRNRNRARIKFLIEKTGVDHFRHLVEQELLAPWASRPTDLTSLAALAPEEPPTPPELCSSLPSDEGYEDWHSSSVVGQRQPGYYSAFVTLSLGDITAAQLRSLALMAQEYAGGYLRTTIRQGMVLRWVREESLPYLYRDLAKAGLAAARAGQITDIVSCPGTYSCSLAIAASRGMADALGGKLQSLALGDAGLKDITINVSGCPNACGQHQVGAIGLHGAVTHHHGRQAPSYELFLGGGRNGSGFHLGTMITKIPAKRVPQAVEAILGHYREERQDGEGFANFAQRLGPEGWRQFLQSFRSLPPVKEEIESYIDWGSTRLFKVERGEGECAL